jgi:tetratricopeptide (TPR) repeat protein
MAAGRGGGAVDRTAGALRAAAPVLVVLAAGVLAYAGTLDVPLQFDDLPNIVDEPAVHAVDLSPAQLAPAVSGFPLGRWLARGSFAVNHALHGLRPAGYHLFNLAAHLAAALLVLVLARRLLDLLAVRPAAGGRGGEDAPAPAVAGEADRRRAATIAALLFVVHPVQTQAVTYVVQRMTVMGAGFALGALLLWLEARRRTGRAFALLAGAAAVAAWLAVSCKENYVVLPGIVLLVEAVLDPALGARLRARWRAALAVAAALGAVAAALLWAYAPLLRSEGARLAIPADARLLSQGRILLHYLSLLALPLPDRLHVDYAWPASTGLLAPATTLPALLAVAGLAALAVAAVRRAPLVTLGVGWFLVALVVEQSVLPIDLVFEQRLYFASIGLFVLAGAALVALVRVPRAGAWAVAAPLVVLLAAGTRARNERWRDPASLYADEAGLAPGAARGLLNVAAALRAKGQLDEAERVLRRLVALAPDEPGAYVNLGNLELDRGRLPAAEGWYRLAIARNPRMADAWYDLGVVLAATGRVAEAMEAYRQTIAAAPTFTSARVNLALLQHRAGDTAGALVTLDDALRVDPGSVFALSNRAVLRGVGGRLVEGLEDARRSVRLGPDRVIAWLVLANLELQAGHRAEARAAAEQAQRLDPRSVEAREILGAIGRR